MVSTPRKHERPAFVAALVVAAICVSVAGPASAQERLQNQDFSSGLSGWIQMPPYQFNGGTVSYSGVGGTAGITSYGSRADSLAEGILAQCVTVDPGKSYTASALARTISASGAARFFLFVLWSSDSACSSFLPGTGRPWLYDEAEFPRSTAWEKAVISSTVPAAAGSASFRLAAWVEGVGSADVLFDNASFIYASSNPPPPTPVITQTAGTNPSCARDSITLDAGAGYTSYTWSTGATTRTITDSPTTSTRYTVRGTIAGSPSALGSWTQTVNPPPATPVISAPTATGAGSQNNVASVVSHAGSSYSWSVTNGTITAGQGASQITFTAGTASTPLTVSVTETNASGCVSAPGNVTVAVMPGFSGFVPIVLDVVGLAHYTSELQLTNLGFSPAAVRLSYTSSMGSGSGEVQETIPAGQQFVYADAISHLRSRGLPIPASGNQGGTLLLSSSTADVRAMVRTSADTADPQPEGRAGLAYSDADPAESSSVTKLYVHGLRTNDADRSNLAVYNMGPDPVSLKVTLVSGDGGGSFEVTARVPPELPAYGWYQYGDGLLLRAAGLSSGYAIIERVSGSGPFGAYGVINDQRTNDGSLIPALPGTQSGTRLTVPVLSEAGSFESELILANRGSATATFALRYVESLSPAKGAGGTAIVEVAAGRQRIIPGAVDFLRSNGVAIGARGEAGYAGSLQVGVSGVGLDSVFAGVRTSSLSPAGGQFGLFCPAIGSTQEASDTAFILGLKADANNRSNVAAIHTGPDGSDPITLEFQVLDGSNGGAPVGTPLSLTLIPGAWVQPPRFFANAGVPNGFVRIRRTAGTAPWYAYGVINDGGNPGERSGDGAYVPMVK